MDMRATTLLSILTILFLLTPLACPMIAEAKVEHSSHACPEDQRNQENQGMHACCDQQAVPVKTVEPNFGQLVEVLPLSGSTGVTQVSVLRLANLVDFHAKKGDFLTKLSILRI